MYAIFYNSKFMSLLNRKFTCATSPLDFPGGSVVKNLPAVQETQVWSLGQEDLLEKEMALQFSCLENPMERGAWQATVYGVAKELGVT